MKTVRNFYVIGDIFRVNCNKFRQKIRFDSHTEPRSAFYRLFGKRQTEINAEEDRLQDKELILSV